jgi:fermentation-respiration switch protein FrsA (DUF1100 family)
MATVAMNAHGVAVEQRYGRPILSGMYAMHSLGGILGAGLAAVAAAIAVGRAGHFRAVATVVAVTGSRPAGCCCPPPSTPARSVCPEDAVDPRGSFTGPALIGALARAFNLTVAFGVPALLVAATAAYARAVQPVRQDPERRAMPAQYDPDEDGDMSG